MSKTDAQLQTDVIDELAFDPQVDASTIGVTAKGGVITLTGTVRNFPEKYAAEHAAKRVGGVRGIAEELLVEIPSAFHRSDADIARAAVAALDLDITVPKNKVTAKVENGWLTLDGTLDWHYQREAAMKAVAHLIGLKGVANAITVKPMASSFDVRVKIRQAFERNAGIDANKVQVALNGDIVTLTGNVRSWSERDEATYAAASVPGVSVVHNYTHVA
jgi:osmotically-inducible protein OsmY